MKLTPTQISRLLGTTMISSGLSMLLFAGYVVKFGDPFSAHEAKGAQKVLVKELEVDSQNFEGVSVALAQKEAPKTITGPNPNPGYTYGSAKKWRNTRKPAQALGQISIPKIGVRKTFVLGADAAALEKGPGIYAPSNWPLLMPGMGQPIAIAGHRTTYGAPFMDLDKLKPGDKIILKLPYGTFEYELTRTRIISPSDWSILSTGNAYPEKALAQLMAKAKAEGMKCPEGTCEHLALTACHPKYSAAQRIAVLAKLKSVKLPAGVKDLTQAPDTTGLSPNLL